MAPGDDRLVVTGAADGVINVWDDKTAEQDDKSRQEKEVLTFVFTPPLGVQWNSSTESEMPGMMLGNIFMRVK